MKFFPVFIVFLGGGLGSSMRYIISMVVQKQGVISFPLATFMANILSCIILIASLKITRVYAWDDSLRLFLIIGICGGLSTFSTFSFETIMLLRNGNFLIASLNVIINILFCFGALFFLLKNH